MNLSVSSALILPSPRSYSRKFPKRCQKEIVKAAIANSPQLNTSTISAKRIDHVLQNIGMSDRMSRSEIEGIIREVGTCPVDESGESHCVISTHQMVDLIAEYWRDHCRRRP